MSVLRAALALTIVVAFCGSCLASESFILREIGQEYAKVREDLLVEGYIPLDQRKNPNRWCFDNPQACRMYPEVSGCAGDEQQPCRFEWETKDRHRFFIITTGEDAHHLTVVNSEDE